MPACVQHGQQLSLLPRGQPCHRDQQTLQLRCLHRKLLLPSTRGSGTNFDRQVAHSVSLSLTNAQRASMRAPKQKIEAECCDPSKSVARKFP